MATLFTGTFDPPQWRAAIWAITAVFESGRPEGDPAAYQNFDSGIVSYGKHQATLASGNLFRILEEYFARSQTPVSQALRSEYAGRVQNADPALRDDGRFKDLLLQAAVEPAMSEAQDALFDGNFFQPAVQRAQDLGLRTPLGLACLYDTRIQGGSKTVSDAVAAKLGGGGVVGAAGTAGPITEDVWIATFLDEREAFLNRLAVKADAEGRTNDAKALRISTFRVTELRALAQAGNYGLSGPFKVRGQTIAGIPPTPAQPKPAQPAVPQPGNNLKIVSFNSPTNVRAVKPGTPFTATWRVRNTGTPGWGPGFAVARQVAKFNEPMASKPVFELAEVCSPATVPAGTEATITIQMKAPPGPDALYRDELRLQDASGKDFGESLLVTVAISR